MSLNFKKRHRRGRPRAAGSPTSTRPAPIGCRCPANRTDPIRRRTRSIIRTLGTISTTRTRTRTRTRGSNGKAVQVPLLLLLLLCLSLSCRCLANLNGGGQQDGGNNYYSPNGSTLAPPLAADYEPVLVATAAASGPAPEAPPPPPSDSEPDDYYSPLNGPPPPPLGPNDFRSSIQQDNSSSSSSLYNQTTAGGQQWVQLQAGRRPEPSAAGSLFAALFSHIDKQWKFAEVILIIVISSVLNLVTIIGNIMVLISFKMDRSLQTVSNYFLLSLALADLLIGLISMPLYTLYLLLNYWPLGPLMCDIWLAIDYLNSNAAVLNMLIISFDRYFSVTRPLTYRAKRTTKHACLMISGAWIVSLTIWTPAIFTYPYYWGRTVQGTDKCEIEFVKANTYLTFVTAILAFYIPVIIMIYLYWRIWLETKKRYRDLTTLFLVSGVGAAVPSRAKQQQQQQQVNHGGASQRPKMLQLAANISQAAAAASQGNKQASKTSDQQQHQLSGKVQPGREQAATPGGGHLSSSSIQVHSAAGGPRQATGAPCLGAQEARPPSASAELLAGTKSQAGDNSRDNSQQQQQQQQPTTTTKSLSATPSTLSTSRAPCRWCPGCPRGSQFAPNCGLYSATSVASSARCRRSALEAGRHCAKCSPHHHERGQPQAAQSTLGCRACQAASLRSHHHSRHHHHHHQGHGHSHGHSHHHHNHHHHHHHHGKGHKHHHHQQQHHHHHHKRSCCCGVQLGGSSLTAGCGSTRRRSNDTSKHHHHQHKRKPISNQLAEGNQANGGQTMTTTTTFGDLNKSNKSLNASSKLSILSTGYQLLSGSGTKMGASTRSSTGSLGLGSPHSAGGPTTRTKNKIHPQNDHEAPPPPLEHALGDDDIVQRGDDEALETKGPPPAQGSDRRGEQTEEADQASKRLVDVATSPIDLTDCLPVWPFKQTLTTTGTRSPVSSSQDFDLENNDDLEEEEEDQDQDDDDDADFETRIVLGAGTNELQFESNHPKLAPSSGGPPASGVSCKYCCTTPAQATATGGQKQQAGLWRRATSQQHHCSGSGSSSRQRCCCAQVITVHDLECQLCRPAGRAGQQPQLVQPKSRSAGCRQCSQQMAAATCSRPARWTSPRVPTPPPPTQQDQDTKQEQQQQKLAMTRDEAALPILSSLQVRQQPQPQASAGSDDAAVRLARPINLDQRPRKLNQKLTFSDILVDIKANYQQQQQREVTASNTTDANTERDEELERRERLMRSEELRAKYGDEGDRPHEQERPHAWGRSRLGRRGQDGSGPGGWLGCGWSWWWRGRGRPLTRPTFDSPDLGQAPSTKPARSGGCGRANLLNAISGQSKLSLGVAKRLPIKRLSGRLTAAEQQQEQLATSRQRFKRRQNFATSSDDSAESGGGGGGPTNGGNNSNCRHKSGHHHHHHHHPIQPKSERKAAKTLSTLLLVFIVTWLPYNVLVLIKTLSGGEDQVPEKIWNFSYYLCYINSTINPLCYALCNAQFRRTYMRILKCKLSNEQHNSSRRLMPLQSSTTAAWNKEAAAAAAPIRLNSDAATLSAADHQVPARFQHSGSSGHSSHSGHNEANLGGSHRVSLLTGARPAPRRG